MNCIGGRKVVRNRTAPDDRKGGLFEHFSVTSREAHLATIKINDELWRDDMNSRAVIAALDELERKHKITFDARMRKREQRARKKVKVSEQAPYEITEHYSNSNLFTSHP